MTVEKTAFTKKAGTAREAVQNLAFALVMAACILLSSAPNAWAARILILHSYHQGLEWTDGIQHELTRIFSENNASHDLDIHYLDMARLGTKAGKE